MYRRRNSKGRLTSRDESRDRAMQEIVKGEEEVTTTTTTLSPTTTTTTTILYSIGDSALGGKIAYILVNGDPGYNDNVQHGLVVALNDTNNSSWGCFGTLISTSDAVGTGNQNTINIIAGCTVPDIAARLCVNLSDGGYHDWYLPSKDELNKLYLNKIAIGMVDNLYWSSSQVDSDANSAWLQYFADGTQYNFVPKDNGNSVRGVRSF